MWTISDQIICNFRAKIVIIKPTLIPTERPLMGRLENSTKQERDTMRNF